MTARPSAGITLSPTTTAPASATPVVIRKGSVGKPYDRPASRCAYAVPARTESPVAQAIPIEYGTITCTS